MQTNKLTAQSKPLIALLALLTLGIGAQAGPTQLTNSPLSGASSADISPNILFVLDDSGSMDWDYLPDWAGDGNPPLFMSKNSSFNGVAYNPTVYYQPPKYFNEDGTANTSTYLSQTSSNTTVWTAVKNDGYGIQSTSTSPLTGNAFYFTTVAGEYCTNTSLKVCTAASAPDATYPIAAKLRWCKTAAEAVAAVPSAGACQATQIEPVAGNTPYNYPRMPSPRTSTITISGSASTSISSIAIDTKQILSVAISATTIPATMALDIETSINACTFGVTGLCQAVGYSAVASGNTVTIIAPGAIGSTPVITKSGSMTVAPTAFARPATNLAPGENLLTVITSTITPGPNYPKTAKRSDCAADPCSFDEEMTNFANWWAYYRTRMQTMKTATSLSFEPINFKKRIGYSSINNNTGTDFQNIAAFELTQKKAWYDKVFSAIPSQNTPLRIALSNAGRLYAGKFNGLAFNGIDVIDPVQHYCQQNVTLLSTDGYWNEGAGFQMDGTTAVGDQDGPGLEVRPQLDGGAPQDQISTLQERKILTPTTATWLQKKTEQLQHRTNLLETRTKDQPQSRTSQLQSKAGQWQSKDWKLQSRTYTQGQTSTLTRIQEQTNQLQMRTGPLRGRTANLQTRTFTQTQERTAQLQSQSGQRQSKTYQLQQRVTQVQQRSSSNGGTSWGSWTNVASCVPDPSGTDRVQCQTLGLSGWNNVASCSVIAGGTTVTNAGTDLEYTTYTTGSECQYTTPSWVDVGSCSPVAKSTASPYIVGTAVDCQTVWSGTWNTAASCDVSPTLQCQYAAWTGYSNVGSCTAQAKSPGPTNYSVGVARECTTSWTPWADTASTCTTSATVGCQYGSWSGYTNDATCAAVAGSTGNPWNVLQKKECAVNYGAWQPNQSTCTPVTSGATQTQCQYLGWSGWSDVGSCATTPLTGPPYAGPGRNCQTLWTTPVNSVGCVANATTACTTTWTNWADVPDPGTCTYSAGATECQYRLAADWHNTASCTANPRSSSPNYLVNQATDCQMTWPNGWVDAVGTCTVATDTQCQYTGWTGWVADATCPAAAVAQSGASPYTTLVAKQCQTDWTGWSAAGASCSFLADTRECRYAGWSGWTNVASATDTPESSGPNYVPAEEQQTLTTSSPEWGPILPASSLADPPPTLSGITCTAGTVAGLTTSCRNVIPNPSLPIPVPACTPEAADATNGWIERTCSTVSTGPTNVASCTGSAATALNSYTTTTCDVIESGATPDTLADVAEYYWKTDLRDPLLSPDRCTGGPVVTGGITTNNNVCTNDLIFTRQFMSTYTLGLGASGLMQYQSDYLTAASGDFTSVKNGTTADLGTGICSWQKNGVCNWPKPASNSQTNIDDLWHAAVNGRGTYFSAGSPEALAAGISSALAGIDAKGGSLTAVTVTSPNLVAGDSAENAVFEISFKSTEWTGDLVKRTINGTTGALSAESVWPSALAAVKKSAKELLEDKVAGGTHTSRTIYTYNPGGESASSAADNLKFFLWANLSSAEQDYFLKPHISTLSQFCASGTTCLDSATQDNGAHTMASGENLLKFVRGDKSHEGTLADLSAYYRSRTNLLGDIVGSEAVYVKGSPWNYADYGYAAFKAANTSTRQAMVYVGANDGMLHAFNSDNGNEEWAYVPTMVIPNLYTLADKNYPAPGFHRFFVDGTPVMGDICTSDCVDPDPSPTWKTILVGGLNNGGRGYYALDISNPAAPKALWEFTDANLGYSYGNPVITKLKDGTWVVIVSSGYNNIGDGEGRLFILNANTGTLIRSISTGVGDTTTPSGLARIAAWANFPDNNNTAQRVYGGDLLGNLWRFDVNGDIPAPSDPPVAADYDAQRLATLKDANGDVQPITSKPELGKIKNYPVVFVGTGQLLGGDDLGTTQRQSLYAIKDKLTNTDYGNPRLLTTTFVAQTLTSGTCAAGNAFCVENQAIVTSTNLAVDFTTKDGWYTDFPVAGERVNTDLRLQLGTLAFNTNTPKSGACVPVGVGYAYFLDYRTGGYVEGTNGMVGIKIGDFLVTSPSVIRLADGTIKELIRTDAPGTTTLPVPTAPSPFDTRRISWRELVTE